MRLSESLLAGLVLLIYMVRHPRWKHDYGKLERNGKWLILTGLVLLAGPVSGWLAGYRNRTEGYLYDYCSYGAVSDAQLDGCLNHVTDEVIDRRDTNAARFAKEQLHECLADAGPFCTHALENRHLEEEAPRTPFE